MDDPDVTSLLKKASGGDRSAVDHLLPLVYQDLRELAAIALRRETPGHTLQATALVHEAYMRLVDQTRVQWNDRTHFYAVAATAIRRILVDHARHAKAVKRGGHRQRVSLDHAESVGSEALDFEALDEALGRLSELDERKARVVELRFFGGLNIDQAAEVLGTSPATVERDWAMARAWLYRELN